MAAICECFFGDNDAAKASRAIDAQLREDKRKYSSELRLLLLGAGESGKSTIVKQMCIIHGNGFERQDTRKLFKMDIVRNVVINMGEILDSLADGGFPLDPAVHLEKDSNRDACRFIRSLSQDMSDNAKDRQWCAERLKPVVENIEPFLADIKALWGDAGVRAAFARSSEYQLSDSAQYLFERIPELHANGWKCSNQDVVRVRNQTSGISEQTFEMEGHNFRIVDVGGQRQERHKWIQCFADVTAIIWVVSTSGFDQRLREDNQSNRLKESIKLFEELWRNRFLRNISVILFLNKTDLLLEKMQRPRSGVRFRRFFSDYSGESDIKAAMVFILSRFEEITKRYKSHDNIRYNKSLYSHFTCAIDTENIQHVFEACKDIIVRLNLVSLGLV